MVVYMSAFTVFLMIQLGVMCHPLASFQSQTGSSEVSAREWMDRAEESAKAHNYERAIECYRNAMAANPSKKQAEDIEKDLGEVKEDFYLELVSQAQKSLDTHPDDSIRSLTLARKLDVEQEALKGPTGLEKIFGGGKAKKLKESAEFAQKASLSLFVRLKSQAAAETAKKSYPQAIETLERARELDPQSFERQNLEAERSRAQAEIEKGESLVQEAFQLLREKRHSAALDKFREAYEVFPHQSTIEEGLTQIENDRREYQKNVTAGDEANQRGDRSAAIRYYEVAKGVCPELAVADDLTSRIEEIQSFADELKNARDSYENKDWEKAHEQYSRIFKRDPGNVEAAERIVKIESMNLVVAAKGYMEHGDFTRAKERLRKSLEVDPDNNEAKTLLDRETAYERLKRQALRHYNNAETCDQAEAVFRTAQNTYPSRFQKEGLGRYLNQECETPIVLDLEKVSRALKALFNFEPEISIQILEDTLEEVPDGNHAARIHAYLGAAYTKVSFLEEEPDLDLLSKAKDHFSQVLTLDPEYRLSERLFSPRILKVFDEVSADSEMFVLPETESSSVP